jgi:hypothetical protein
MLEEAAVNVGVFMVRQRESLIVSTVLTVVPSICTPIRFGSFPPTDPDRRVIAYLTSYFLPGTKPLTV